ncbi:MAG: hypothetical protein H6811_02480 [Phycisphaeraceae bacterium]|nr:hypothetical protein [Phycisphaeraceae bacterium]
MLFKIVTSGLAQISEPSPASGSDFSPTTAHGVVALGLLAGLMLWIFGGRVVRPAFAALGVLVGGALGFLLLPLTGDDQVLGIPTAYAGLGAGCVAGLVASVLLFRAAMILCAIGAGCAFGLLGTMVFLQYAPSLMPETPPSEVLASPHRASEIDLDTSALAARDLTSLNLADSSEALERFGAQMFEGLDRHTRHLIQGASVQARDFGGRLWMQSTSLWQGLTQRERMVIMCASLVGAGLGLVIGLGAPTKSARLVTSMGGAVVMLGAVAWLAESMSVPGHEMLHRSPLAWSALWLAVSGLGVFVQNARARSAG